MNVYLHNQNNDKIVHKRPVLKHWINQNMNSLFRTVLVLKQQRRDINFHNKQHYLGYGIFSGQLVMADLLKTALQQNKMI